MTSHGHPLILMMSKQFRLRGDYYHWHRVPTRDHTSDRHTDSNPNHHGNRDHLSALLHCACSACATSFDFSCEWCWSTWIHFHTCVCRVVSSHDYHRLCFVIAKLLDANQWNYVPHLHQDSFPDDTQVVVDGCVLVVHMEESLGVRQTCATFKKPTDKNSINYSRFAHNYWGNTNTKVSPSSVHSVSLIRSIHWNFLFHWLMCCVTFFFHLQTFRSEEVDFYLPQLM